MRPFAPVLLLLAGCANGASHVSTDGGAGPDPGGCLASTPPTHLAEGLCQTGNQLDVCFVTGTPPAF